MPGSRVCMSNDLFSLEQTVMDLWQKEVHVFMFV